MRQTPAKQQHDERESSLARKAVIALAMAVWLWAQFSTIPTPPSQNNVTLPSVTDNPLTLRFGHFPFDTKAYLFDGSLYPDLAASSISPYRLKLNDSEARDFKRRKKTGVHPLPRIRKTALISEPTKELSNTNIENVESSNDDESNATLERASSAIENSVPLQSDAMQTSDIVLIKANEMPQVIEDGSSDEYIDKLIDPSTPKDIGFADDYRNATKRSGQISHSLQLVSTYRKNSQNNKAQRDSGLHYVATTHTANFGKISLNLVALESNDSTLQSSDVDNSNGIKRVNVTQRAFPLTEKIIMDNTLGAHRKEHTNPFSQRGNLINHRFSAAEPDVFGLSSAVKMGASQLAFTTGELGETNGRLLPGFEEREGNIKRASFATVRNKNAIGVNYWSTDGQTELDNRSGYKVSWDSKLSENLIASATLAGSKDQKAFLLGGASNGEFTRQDFGLYYFEPDFIWMNSTLGDDNKGAFYRVNTQSGAYHLGASIEHRKDGLLADSSLQRDTSFASFNLARRLSRDSSASSVYSFRRVKDRAQEQDEANNSTGEHAVRAYYTRSHSNDSRSNIGLRLRHSNKSAGQSINYGWSRDFNNDSNIEISAEYSRRTTNEKFQEETSLSEQTNIASKQTGDTVSVDLAWNKGFYGGGYLGIGAGYNFSDSNTSDDSGLSAYMSYDQTIASNLSLSLHVDYSRSESKRIDRNFSDELFTDSNFVDDELLGSNELSASLSLQYHFGRSNQPSVISQRPGYNGSGTVRGRLFLDSNGDGTRQPNEVGLEGITVFLDSVHPTITDSRGDFHFQRVGVGEHFIFVDESTLPLPWTLSEGEYNGLTVNLRGTTIVDIAVSPITLAQNEE